jgi:hypothetical protein
MNGVIPPHPQYAFMAWCSVEAQGQLYLFTFYLQVSKFCTENNIQTFRLLDTQHTMHHWTFHSSSLFNSYEGKPKFSRLVTWSENCKSYRSLPPGAVLIAVFESV